MTFKIISKNLKRKNFETSVILPIRADKKVYNLLKQLSNQKYSNFVLLIANDSKIPYLKKENFPKNLSYKYYHTSEEKYSTFEKLNFLIDQVATPYLAITESDCEPSESWLSELLPIVKKEKCVIKGSEARPIKWCTSNLVMPSSIAKKEKFDINIPIAGDYDQGIRIEKKGYPFKILTHKGLVYHNILTGKARFNRIIPCARDDVYMAIKYRSPGFLWHKILRNGYAMFNGLSQNILYAFFLPYLLIKKFINNLFNSETA